MSLTESLDNIVKYTAKINTYLNPQNLLSVKIPGANLGKVFGEEGINVTTLGDVIEGVERIGGDIMTGVNIIRCAFVMGSDGYLGFLGQMAMGVTSVIMSIADQIIEAVAIQLGNAVRQIVGVITSIVSALHNLWTSVSLLIKSLGDLWDSWTKDIDFDIDFELQKENCKDMYAAIAGCMLNKYLGPYLDEFKEKAIREINKGGEAFNNMLYEELSDVRTYAAYAHQEAFLLKKAQIQIDGLQRDKLIG